MRKLNTISFVLALACLAFVWTAPANAVFKGDANADGARDVLDAQEAINEALGEHALRPEADLNDDNGVDVVDIQNLVNTILGTGGLIQHVIGDIGTGITAPTRVVAVSDDGRMATANVDPATLHFEIELEVEHGWAMMVLDDRGAGQPEGLGGTIHIPAGGNSTDTSMTVSIPKLSIGVPMDLRTLNFVSGVAVSVRDERHLNDFNDDNSPDVEPGDDNGNGIENEIENEIEFEHDALHDAVDDNGNDVMDAADDGDADGIPDLVDDNPRPDDNDRDGIPDANDVDDDNDGVPDDIDAAPLDPNVQ